jgi:hypothetical protein
MSRSAGLDPHALFFVFVFACDVCQGEGAAHLAGRCESPTTGPHIAASAARMLGGVVDHHDASPVASGHSGEF